MTLSNRKLENMHKKALNSSSAVKYFKRLKQYKSNNFKFDLATQNGTSYDWWDLVNVQKGMVVFNTYRYSNSTSKHISKMYSIIQALKIKNILYVNTSQNIRSSDWTTSYAKKLQYTILENEMFLDRKRNKDWYLRCIKGNKKMLNTLEKKFKVKITKSEIETMRKEIIDAENSRLETNRKKRAEIKAKKELLKSQLTEMSELTLFNKSSDLTELVLSDVI